jgi:hypothetical protein
MGSIQTTEPERRRKRVWPRAILTVAAFLSCLLLAGVIANRFEWPAKASAGEPLYGADFSCRQAEWLGEDCRAAYTALLDQLAVKHVRLSAYWDEIEPRPGVYDFSSIDWQIDEAAQRGVGVTLTVGIKGQRAPEFYVPDWALAGRHIADGSSPADYPDIVASSLAYVRATVEHESNRNAIEVWQVDNEPYVHFWRTAHDWSLPSWFVVEEANAIRQSDPTQRPLLITHASWLSTDRTWRQILKTADIVGEAVYTKRQRGPLASNYLFPFQLGPLTPNLPGQEAAATRLGKSVWISELQAEPFEAPWVELKGAGCDYPTISPELLRNNLALADRSGVERAYLWGAEWWYYCLTQKGDPSMWEAARQAFAISSAREISHSARSSIGSPR